MNHNSKVTQTFCQQTLGEFIDNNSHEILFEIGDEDWEFGEYLEELARMQETYEDCISENRNNVKNTIGLNDLSIIALAKVLGLPVVSMEADVREDQTWKRRIPNICRAEGVDHFTFSEFCREEGFKF